MLEGYTDFEKALWWHRFHHGHEKYDAPYCRNCVDWNCRQMGDDVARCTNDKNTIQFRDRTRGSKGCKQYELRIFEDYPDLFSKPKIIVLCGSSKFVEVMAVTAWLLEKEEGAITMGLHLLPGWYAKDVHDHLAESEGIADKMDELHKRKIDLADEIFIINYLDYIGDSTMAEMTYAAEKNIPARWFNPPPDKEQDLIAKKVQAIINR